MHDKGLVRAIGSGFGEIDGDGKLVVEDAGVYCITGQDGGREFAATTNLTLVANDDGTLTWEPFDFTFQRTGS